ncbi:hypothetical protein [Thalassotalea piscium]|uniref:Uncharacterized protein n=1 Tax=Thalassotalea piscium TaxID=1230533 RepID=A0A7X0TTB1_9GAMM|nr:hypothetical protein [Thalassotalea piscium]MBB6543062.1 hypothetical protein [Thalassotalea piscium]
MTNRVWDEQEAELTNMWETSVEEIRVDSNCTEKIPGSVNELDSIVHTPTYSEEVKNEGPILARDKEKINNELDPQNSNIQDSVNTSTSDQPEVGALTSATTQQKEFSHRLKFKPSKKASLPFVLMALIFLLGSMFPNSIISMLFTPEDLVKLSEQSSMVVKYMPVVVKWLMYITTILLLFIGYKQVSYGSLEIFDSYILHRKGLLKKTKVMFQENPSIEVHRAPFSLFFDIGHLEITTPRKDFQINNIKHPFKIKRLIEDRIKG